MFSKLFKSHNQNSEGLLYKEPSIYLRPVWSGLSALSTGQGFSPKHRPGMIIRIIRYPQGYIMIALTTGQYHQYNYNNQLWHCHVVV